MKRSGISQISMLCGLVVGAMALWVGTAPIGVSGDIVTGGWSSVYHNGERFACDIADGCVYCNGGHYEYCSDYDGYTGGTPCSGGLVWVAESGGTTTAHAGGTTNCYHPNPNVYCRSDRTKHASAEYCW